MQQGNPDDNKPVTRGYLKEVLKRVEESLQEYSQAIAKLQQQPPTQGRSQSYMNTNRVAQIEQDLTQMRERIQANTQTDRREEASQDTLGQEAQQLASKLQQEVQRLSSRIDQREQVEKREEYDQNVLERDYRQHERDYDLLERRVLDIENKLRRS